MPKQILRLNVRLLDCEPAIWRRFEIPADATFWDLHVALQNVMGWTDSHLHDFQLSKANGRDTVWVGRLHPTGLDEREILPERETRLASRIHRVGARFHYHYDYGDDWRHEVVVEAIAPGDPTANYPRCLSGARACPPEDVGGPWGYANFLAAIKDPGHEEHEEYLEWIGEGFDPSHFDPDEVVFEDPQRHFGETWG